MTSEPLTVEELARLGVTIDPMVMSGQPVIKGTRIPASTVAARFFGGKSVVYLAKDHNIRFDQVEAAIRYAYESHSRRLWLEAPQVAWLIEQAGLCLGFCEYKFAFVTFTNENALRFARQRDAIAFRETIKRSPFNLPVGDAVVTEHQWIGPKAESTPKPSPALPTQKEIL